jgi:predicted alpha/beta-fold hydrolase
MPVINADDYLPSFLLKNKHLNTIAPTLFRKVTGVNYKRHRLNTPDGDFIDYDVSTINSKSAAIIIHGLEGNSHKAYVKGAARALNSTGIDALAMNLRGCSEEDNLLFTSYHSGKTDDLELIVNQSISKLGYENIFILGFSLGGNITLKYAGEEFAKSHDKIIAIAAISVPCDLKATAYQLDKPSNYIYLHRFLKTLKKKAINKLIKHKNNAFSVNKLKLANSFSEFDDLFTAPVHGFKNAEDYWIRSSSLQFLPKINLPALIINAHDDPFLPKECYPYKIANQKSNIYLQTPKFGGHVGFMTNFRFEKMLWHERQIVDFFRKYI